MITQDWCYNKRKVPAGAAAPVVWIERQENNIGSGYLISWCVGHLVELAPPSAYGERYVKWNIADLPILPEKWQYLVSASTKKQFFVLKKLLHRADVETVVNSCDAGQCGWVT